MSQQPMEQMNMDGQPQGSPEVETDCMPGQDGEDRGRREEEFSLGLDAALNENESGGAVPQENEQEEESRAAPEETPATAAPVAPQAGPDTAYAPEQPLHEPAAPQEAKPVPESPQVPDKMEMPEHLQNEFERLQAIDPELAQLALEDSADGQAIRARLEEYGAAIAHDHARLVVLTRQQRHDMELVRQEQAMRDEQARQAHFMGVMQQEHPDFYSLITGKDQAAQVRFRNWPGCSRNSKASAPPPNGLIPPGRLPCRGAAAPSPPPVSEIRTTSMPDWMQGCRPINSEETLCLP